MQVPINPYGKAKKMAEEIILDFSKSRDLAVMILRFVLYDSSTNTGSDMIIPILIEPICNRTQYIHGDTFN